MRLALPTSVLAFSLTAGATLLCATRPALARPHRHTPCTGHFLVDPGQSPLVAGGRSAVEGVDISGKLATITGACAAQTRLRAMHKGWRIRTRWGSCGGLEKVRLVATVGFDCRKLTLALRAKHRARTFFTASPSACGGGAAFTGTWDAIQKTILAQHDCANDLCHGSAKQGGLDLRPDAAYQSLVQVPSTEVPSLDRVEPGDERRSYLYLKLLAKTDPATLASELPAGVQITGSPMPNNTTTLSTNELEALRLWIYATAPQTGTVSGTQSLLNTCLPAPTPISAIPLPPPAPGQGIQFVMPPWKLEANSEHEICFATYYDLTGKVPVQFTDGNSFFWNAQTLRQDPQSHHLLLNLFAGSLDQIHDPSFGTWTCNGGGNAGQVCEPTDLTSCGSGTCTSTIKPSFACIGYGPQAPGKLFNYIQVGGAQKAQSEVDFAPGVWAPFPLKGILFWNSHAFNLTAQDTMMHAWLNYDFAQNRQYLADSIFDIDDIFGATGIPPYQVATICNDFTFDDFSAPKQAYVFSLSSHTHRHGQHFWITDPQHGNQLLYENFVYNDPPTQTFDPPLVFNAGDKLHYCATFNNGVAAGGVPDPTLVTRASQVPPEAPAFSHCTPVMCVAGKMSPPASCRTNGDCDSKPGASDGVCDACPIVGGESTANEMFILIGQYYVK